MKIIWTLSVEDANYILAALGDRPFKEVAALIAMLKTTADAQVVEQQKAAEQAAAPAPAPEPPKAAPVAEAA